VRLAIDVPLIVLVAVLLGRNRQDRRVALQRMRVDEPAPNPSRGPNAVVLASFTGS
jgi:hypothetical protein